MRLKAVSVEEFHSMGFLPQAVLKESVSNISEKLGEPTQIGHDQFDDYEGLAFKKGDLAFTVLHYHGHPEGTATIYLPPIFTKIPQITELVSSVLGYLKVAPDALIWQRKDDPDL